jgi:hypothetical protein
VIIAELKLRHDADGIDKMEPFFEKLRVYRGPRFLSWDREGDGGGD